MGSLQRIKPLDVDASTPSSAVSAVNTIPTIPHAVRPVSYSVDKFLALDNYTTTTSPWRVAGVMLVTPIPGLIAALVPALVPLQDPLSPDGVRANPGYLACAFLITLIVGVGTLMHWRAGAELSPEMYTGRQIVGVALVSAVIQYAFALVLVFSWRFPMPMSYIVVSSVMGTGITIGHIAVFRERCWHDKELIDGIKRYIPAMSFQTIQIILYPAFSVLFDNVTTVYQVLLTLAFPLLKYVMKKGLRSRTRELKDFNNEVAVTGIEICASLYQSMILQNAPSNAALIIIMVFDVLQGLVAVKFFMDRPAQTAQNQIVREALKQLHLSKPPGSGVAGSWVEGSQTRLPGHSVVPTPTSGVVQKTLDKSTTAWASQSQVSQTVKVGERRMSTTTTPAVVADALQLVSVAESILLVEYLEVAIPMVNAIFVAVACQFNGAQYNTRLRRLYFHPDALAASLQSIVFYSFLQALSFVAMHLVMRYRYGLSATYHLAFVLEHHWESIVGKMIGWLPVILHFTLIHFGVDFSFRFDFAAMLRDENSP